MRRGLEPSRRGQFMVIALLLAACWQVIVNAPPRADAQGGLLFAERFDNNANAWMEYSDVRVEGGKLKIDSHAPVTSWTWMASQPIYDDFDVRATFVAKLDPDTANGIMWLGFRMANGDGILYGFGCAPHDHFCNFVRVDSGPFERLAVIRDLTALRSGAGAVNVLRVVARGREFSFYINNQHVLDMRDEGLQAGYFGLGASKFSGGEWSVDIDDLEVRTAGVVPTWTNTPIPTNTRPPTDTPVPTNTKPPPPTATTLPTETPRIIPTASPTRDRRTVLPPVTFTPNPEATPVVLPTPVFHVVGRAFLPHTANRGGAAAVLDDSSALVQDRRLPSAVGADAPSTSRTGAVSRPSAGGDLPAPTARRVIRGTAWRQRLVSPLAGRLNP